jgi:hypothetical protein
MTAPALTIVMTNAGLARFTAAQLGEPVDLTVATIGLTNADFIVAPTLTALPGKFREISTISGQAIGDNVIHLVLRDDDEAAAYTARGFGLFFADGTLFAVYGQPAALFSKSLQSSFMAAIDLAFPTPDIDRLTFGDANWLNPPATTETAGVLKLATLDQANAGDSRRAVTGAVVKAMIGAAVAGFQTTLDNALAGFGNTLTGAIGAMGEALDGLAARTVYGNGLVKGGGRNDVNRTLTVDTATAAEIVAGTAQDRAVTPGGLGAAGAVYVVEHSIAGGSGYRRWSDGLKECWGSIGVPANTTVPVDLPILHTDNCVPVGSCSIPQDEASIGVLNPSAGGFQVRNRNPVGTTFYWHTKGV